jgi:hypothetical protein
MLKACKSAICRLFAFMDVPIWDQAEFLGSSGILGGSSVLSIDIGQSKKEERSV